MNWLHYLIEANIYLGVFYVAYCLFLAKETYYQLNRAYLVLSCMAAFILPLVQVGLLKPVEVTIPVAYTAPIEIQTIVAPAAINTPIVIEHHFTLQDALCYTYLLGAIILLLLLFIKLYTLFRLTRTASAIKETEYKLIQLPETNPAFSFFNYLFIGANATCANTIIRHELVHIRQKHSADIIFMELLKVINWFNPFIYLLQNSLKAVHEYIADEQTAIYETDAPTYSSFLVNNAYGAGGSSITHSFYNYNLLKKRIIRLNQQRSGNVARLKYLVAVPICMGLLCASTLGFSKNYGWVDVMPAKNSLSQPNSVTKRDTIPRTVYLLRFLQNLQLNTKYPAEAIKNKVWGHVIATFTVVDDYKLENIKIVTRAGHGIGKEVMSALQKSVRPVNLMPGKYAVPFYFANRKDVHGHTIDENNNINEFKGIADGYKFLDEVNIDYPSIP